MPTSTNPSPSKLCFVVSPIGAAGSEARRHADWLLQGIIEPVFRESFKEFSVERADKINAPGMIDSQVINRLLDAELVIADMSLLNANAFYEMGIRHMAQKPIVHMYQEGGAIPFDVAPHRAIVFSYSHPSDLVSAQLALKAAVDEATKPEFQVDNPVTRARGAAQIEEHATPEQRVLLDQITALTRRVTNLEKPNQAFAGFMTDRAGQIPAPPSSSIFLFRSSTRLTQEHAEIIQSAMARKFGISTLLSKSPREVILAVPGNVEIADIELPANLPNMSIIPMQPTVDPGHY